MRNATRYLCAAAYLDEEFRETVLRELLDDPHRAVPPSYGGLDLAPVIAHCLKARRLLLVREVIISVLLVVMFFVHPALFASLLAILLPWALLTLPRVRRSAVIWRALLVIWGLWALVTAFIGGILGVLLGAFQIREEPVQGLDAVFGDSRLELVLWAACFLVALGYWVARYIALAERLKPGTGAVADIGPADPGRRIDYVRAAQWGNVTLYGTENPFLGAGNVYRSWSIAVELDRRSSGSDRSRSLVRIDPVDLHKFVRGRLSEMRDAAGSPEEGISRMHVSHHLAVGGTLVRLDRPEFRGRRRWRDQSHPLIDGRTGLPQYTANDETIEAVIRQPQSGIRYYQRVTVGTEGPEIRNSSGQMVFPAVDNEVVVSAFFLLDVQGRMLYTEFVVTVLPAIRSEYHIVDVLPMLTPATLLWRAIQHVRFRLVRDVLFAPFRLIRTVRNRITRDARTANPAEFLVYPYGARLSVRELGAETGMRTYMELLDRDKFSKLIQQRLTEAVLDYLEQHGVDTAGYREQAKTVINNGTMITGGTVNGAVAGGEGAKATQTVSAKD
jgi:hypothetical protein